MNKHFLKDGLGWGFLLWLVGYILGFIFFMMAPPAMIGWLIMPIGILMTLWVLIKKINNHSFSYLLKIAVCWTVIAIVCDYLFLVKILNPADGYYKLDVYLYYLITFALPLVIGLKNHKA